MIKAETMERNVTLDFVRGVAILGILLLNISAFGLPKAAYLNPAWYGAIVPEDAWSWAILDIVAQAKFLTLFALLFGAGLQMLLLRGKQWIQSRLTLLVLLGFIHALFFWDGDILLAYGLVGLICWRLVRDAPSVKSLFNTGILLYLVGIGVLLLLGVVSSSETSRAWTPDASAILYEKYWKLNGGMEAISNRAEMLSNSLLALGAQYGWQLAGMMLLGAALMRRLAERSVQSAALSPYRGSAGGVRANDQPACGHFTMAAGLGVPLVRLLIAGAARTERAVANAGLCRADVWLLAAA